MNNKYINNKTYEIVDNVFEVDELIADTISNLNKKGYHTLYSCSGHVKDPRLYEKYPIEKIDTMNDSYLVDENKFVLVPYSYTEIYIYFDSNYSFINLPEGFSLDILDSKSYIYLDIDYYDNGIKKDQNNIQKEINKNNQKLLEWSNNLINLN